MNDKTRQIVIVIFAVCAALVLLFGALTFYHELVHNQVTVPATVSVAFAGFLVTLLTAAGVFVNGMLSRAESRRVGAQVQQTVNNRIDETQVKLADGFGDAVAQKVAEHVPAVIPNAIPGGRRSTDPPIAPNGVSHGDTPTPRL